MTRPLLILALSLLLCSAPLHAQKKKAPSQHPRLAGLSLAVDAGLLIPSNKQANFYSGRPGNANTIDRVLRSQQYGTQIWNSLVDQQLISPSAIPSYSAFRIADGGYPRMHYKLTYQIGLGLRYDYSNGWAWSLAFDFSQVTAAGQFLLSSDNGVGIPGSRQFVACDIFGLEKRILIDLSVAKHLPLTSLLDLEMAAGVGVNNTKVSENAMVIAGHTYSILDVWNGQDPYAGIGSYPYINQGGIGFGALASLALCYSFHGARADLGYQLRYMQTKYKGYNDNNSFALQHIIYLRFNINNFKF